MVILEGPDASGKSTFISKAKEMGYPIVKSYYPKKNQLRYYLLSGPLYAGSWVERYYPSEMVYPRVKPDRIQMEDYKQHLIEVSLQPFNPVILYFRPPLEVILQNIQNRGDDYINLEEVKRVVEEYDKFMDRTLIHVVRHDYTKDKMEKTLDHVEKFHYLSNPVINPGLNAGDDRHGGLMIVGEQPSNNSIGAGFIRPFISDTGSSLFFHECLHESGLYKSKKMPYFTNFYKFSSHEEKADEENMKNLAEEINTINPRKIICLGNEAYDKTQKTLLHKKIESLCDLVFLEHPSYIKRFGGKEGKQKYIEDIKKAII